MQSPRKWIWILLFVVASVVLTVLATTWNLVWIRTSVSLSLRPQAYFATFLGSVGFIAALVVLSLFFYRLLREMARTQWQRDFLMHVSHELKTPIATLELTSDLLRREDRDPNHQPLWQSHQRELVRLKLEVQRLLESARVAHQNAASFFDQFPKETIAIEKWFKDSWSHWEALLSGKLERRGDDLSHEIITTHLRVLDLVVRNLLDNARKFAQPGQVPQVFLVTRLLPNSIELAFEDDGVGFIKRDRRRILKRFGQGVLADSSPAGFGFGLFISKKAAQFLGFKFSAKSAGKGLGAIFTLRIPRQSSAG